MADTALKGSTIATSYDWLIFRETAFSSTGNKINLMNDSGVIQASNFYIDPTNDRIGIGTAKPDMPLTVASSTGGFMSLRRDEGTIQAGEVLGELKFGGSENSGTNTGYGAAIQAVVTETNWVDNANEGSSLNFQTAANTEEALSNRMTIYHNGNVGIGTTTPASAFDIESTTDGNYAARIKQDHATGWGVVIDNQGTTTGDPILNLTANNGSNQVFWADSNGNVGIGTATPAYLLELEGDNTTALSLMNQSDTAIDDGDTLGTIYFGGRDDGTAGTNALGAKIVAQAAGLWGISGDANDAPTELQFWTSPDGSTALTQKMVITDSGNVGIGTTAPGEKLGVEVSSGSVAIEIESVSLADTQIAQCFAKGKKSGGSNRYASVGVMYNASGTGATDQACGFLRMDEGDGTVIHIWAQDDNDLQISADSNDVGSTDGVAIGSQTSDERLKNISSDAFPYGLNEVNQLTPIKYTYKSNPDKSKIGFGAQTTQSIIPECVYNSGDCPDGYTQDLYTTDDDEVKNGEKQVGDEKGTQTPKSSEKDKLYMKYVEIVPVLVKAVQELSAKVTALENA